MKTEEDIFRKPTYKTWILSKNRHTIEAFIEATNNEINEEIAHIKPSKYSNLSRGEQKALWDLQERDDVVIVNADKVVAVVIMDVTDYIDQTAGNNETVNNVTERFQKENLIIKNVVEGLKTTSPWTPRFYI